MPIPAEADPTVTDRPPAAHDTKVIRVTQVTGSLASGMGGIPRAVLPLCDSLAASSDGEPESGRVDGGVQVEIVANDLGPEYGEVLRPESRQVKTHLVKAWASKRFRMAYGPQFQATLEAACRDSNADLIHDNGVWLPTNRAAARVARTLGRPRIVTPHGMLTPWALRHKRWKKRIVWSLYARRNLDTADALLATCEQEAREFRELGLRPPIAVVPNGVEFDEVPRDRRPATEPREILFLSRVHPKKGLPNLVRAMAELRPSGWKVVLAGPDEDGHAAEIQSQIDAANLGDAFEFTGPLEGQAKARRFARASLFVLPTHSENFGIVVAEALIAGVPVITTHGAPWEELEQKHCGWWIPIGVDPLVTALREAVGLTDGERQAMGRRGQELVQQRYAWPRVAGQVREVYRWILEGGPRPACVRV